MSESTASIFEFLLRQGDNALVLGHRTSEWCGVAPALEEDIALANIALDLIGQAKLWLDYACKFDGAERTANALAFRRDFYDFRNILMVELPNEDYARTIIRHFLFDAFQVPWLDALVGSSDENISNIGQKTVKEAKYHLERSQDTVIALGDGTEESNRRMQKAVLDLWPYAGEMFQDDEIDRTLHGKNIAPLPSSIKKIWNLTVERVFDDALLTLPDSVFSHSGGRKGSRHTEHLGHLLATMQFLQRAYPSASW
mgnify:CR=1 FL=1